MKNFTTVVLIIVSLVVGFFGGIIYANESRIMGDSTTQILLTPNPDNHTPIVSNDLPEQSHALTCEKHWGSKLGDIRYCVGDSFSKNDAYTKIDFYIGHLREWESNWTFVKMRKTSPYVIAKPVLLLDHSTEKCFVLSVVDWPFPKDNQFVELGPFCYDMALDDTEIFERIHADLD